MILLYDKLAFDTIILCFLLFFVYDRDKGGLNGKENG